MLKNLIVELSAFFIFGVIAVSCLLFWDKIEKKVGTFWAWLIVPPVIFIAIISFIVVLCKLFPNM